jgi:hypothetical protein
MHVRLSLSSPGIQPQDRVEGHSSHQETTEVAMIAMAVVLGVTAGLCFIATWLALRHVRPGWLRMRCVLGRWLSFTVEMDGRVPRQREIPLDEQPTPGVSASRRRKVTRPH